jgi:dTDP-glucose 4,6-dehydratase
LKSLLIIGATGFFGQSILKHFSESETLNKKIDNIIICSRKKYKNQKLLIKLKKKYKISIVNLNLLYTKNLPEADYVIYTAIIDDNYYKDYLAVKNYCSLAKKYHKNSLILYISSGAVYGKQTKKIKSFRENYLVYQKKISFGDSYKKEYSYIKLKNEKLFRNLARYGLNISIARCFNIVGEFIPRDSNFVIGNIIQNILDKKKITIKANYKVIRSYMYSDDLAKWLLKILYSSNINCPIFNVGSDDAISIHKLADFLAKKYKVKITKSDRISNVVIDKYVPNIQKAKKQLNLKVSSNSYDSIVKTIRLIKSSN